MPARGGAEVALGLYYIFFSYRTCMRRAPARPVRACFVGTCCAVVVQEHRRRPRCNATPSEHFLHTSHCALHTPHFALHTSHFISSHLFSPHLTSSQLFSSHLIPSLFKCHLSKFLLSCFHLIPALISLSHLLEILLNLSQLFCTPESSYCQRLPSLHK